MKKIALIECWFGPFPPWHDFYLMTCAANADVDWFIFHDAPRPRCAAPNIHFFPLTKSELEARASELLGTSLKLPSGLKVCDLRSTFGTIFAAHLTDHDFWGYNDSDVFWGRIRHHLTDEILERFDVITSCRASVVGQFTLFRNSGPARDLFRHIPDFLPKLLHPTLTYLDEGELDAAAVSAGLRIYRRQLQVHDANDETWENKARAMELAEKGHLREWFWEEGPCRWESGRVVHIGSGKETMFVHFKLWKSEWKKHHRVPRFRYRPQLLKGFTVSSKGIHLHFKPSAALFAPFYLARYHLPRLVLVLKQSVSSASSRIARGLKRRLSALS